MPDPAPVFVIRHPRSGHRYRETEGGWLILTTLTYTTYPSEDAAAAARDRMLGLVRRSVRESFAAAMDVTPDWEPPGDEALGQTPQEPPSDPQ